MCDVIFGWDVASDTQEKGGRIKHRCKMAAAREELPYSGYCPIPHLDGDFHEIPGAVGRARNSAMIWKHVRDEHIVPFLRSVVRKHEAAATGQIVSPSTRFTFRDTEISQFAADSERLLQRLEDDSFLGANNKVFWEKVYRYARVLSSHPGHDRHFPGDPAKSALRIGAFFSAIFIRISQIPEYNNVLGNEWYRRWYIPEDGVGNVLREYSLRYASQVRERGFMIFAASRRYIQDSLEEEMGMTPLIFSDDPMSSTEESELLGIPSADVDIFRPATATDILTLGDISGDITDEQLEAFLSTQSLESVSGEPSQTSFEEFVPPVVLPPGSIAEETPLFSDDPMRMAAARALVKYKGNVKAAARAVATLTASRLS